MCGNSECSFLNTAHDSGRCLQNQNQESWNGYQDCASQTRFKNNWPFIKIQEIWIDPFDFLKIGDHLNSCSGHMLPATVCQAYLEKKNFYFF